MVRIRAMKIISSLTILIIGILCMGCGASTGTGFDSAIQSNSQKTLQVSEVLAVDDLLIGSTLLVGTEIQDGKLTGLIDTGVRTTGIDGKVPSFSLSVSSTTTFLYFQISQGKNGPFGSDLSADSRFFGVIELDSNLSNYQQSRVNINPFSTLTSFAKSRSPGRKVSDLALSLASPFFTASATTGIDINSIHYTGLTSAKIESHGEAAFLQIMNEMIRVAAREQVGADIADKISNFCKRINSEIEPGEDIFSDQGTVFESLSAVSTQLATSPQIFGDFFSRAITQLSTSSTATYRPESFVAGNISASSITIGTHVKLDNFSAVIEKITSGVALITAAQEGTLNLTSIPARVGFDLSPNQFKAPVQGLLHFGVKRAADDSIEATVNPIKLDARSPFTMIIPRGAVISGARRSPDGSFFNVTSINQAEDQFVSTTGFMEIPVGELIARAESVSGSVFPNSDGRVLQIEVRLEQMPVFRVEGFKDSVTSFRIPALQITP